MQAVIKYTPAWVQSVAISLLVSEMEAPSEFILINPKIAFDEGNISRTTNQTGLKFDNGHMIPDRKSNGMEVKR